VLEDFQPYVCTHQNCDLGDHFFNGRDEWYEHESQRHRITWCCNTVDHPQYDSQMDFINHMKENHGTTFDESRLATVQDIFRQPSRRIEGTCNLCMRESKKLKSHVSRHLQQMALFALPRVNEIAGSGEAEHCTVSSKYAAKDAGDEHNDNDESQSSEVSAEDHTDNLEQEQDSTPLNPQDDGLVAFWPDGMLIWEEAGGQSWDDITNKFSDAREGRSAEPPLMPSDDKPALDADQILVQAQIRFKPSSTVPFQRDSAFVGREGILAQVLGKHEQVGTCEHSRVALVGLGGVGFVFRHVLST
jgi:hypothetical protein